MNDWFNALYNENLCILIPAFKCFYVISIRYRPSYTVLIYLMEQQLKIV